MKPSELREAIEEAYYGYEIGHPEPVIMNADEVIDAILDAVIASLPEDKDAYRDGSELTHQIYGHNSALAEVRHILHSAKSISKESDNELPNAN